jgi:hypothetical protein
MKSIIEILVIITIASVFSAVILFLGMKPRPVVVFAPGRVCSEVIGADWGCDEIKGKEYTRKYVGLEYFDEHK